jgi:hypothetical protein
MVDIEATIEQPPEINVTITEQGQPTAWGDITGTLSDQTDLDTALSGFLKLNQTTPQIIINGIPSITNGLLIGSSSNFGDVPSGGLAVSGNIIAYDKVYLDYASNTYFQYNGASSEVELYVGGSIKASW